MSVSRGRLKLAVATDIDARLRDLVLATGRTQAALAESAGVHANQFSIWLRKGGQRPPATRLRSWAKREGWPLEIFLEGGPMPSAVLKPAAAATMGSHRVIGQRPAHYVGDASGQERLAAGDDDVTPTAQPQGPAAEVALTIAREVARVIEEFIQLDEADKTRAGRETIARALEDFAFRCLKERDSPGAAMLSILAGRIRRGEM